MNKKELKIAANVRKPVGNFGVKIAKEMNVHHENLAKWGLSHIKIDPQYQILDIGCGGGRNINRFASLMQDGTIYGIDYSKTAIMVTSELNQEYINKGIVQVKQASVSNIPFSEQKFDLVTAFESIYFWPDLINDLKEVLRVLKVGGKFVIINEMYECNNKERLKDAQKWAKLCNFELHTVDQYRTYLNKAGFIEISIFEEFERGWIAVITHKPSIP